MLLGGVAGDEAAVKIVDQIGCAPIQVGQDGGGIGGDQAAEHESDPARGQEAQHRGIGDVVAE